MSNQDRQTNRNGAAGNGAIRVSIGGNVLGQVAVGHQVHQRGPESGPEGKPRANGHAPDRLPGSNGANGAQTGADRVRLLALLRNLFDESELRDLFFELRVDYEAVGGRSPHEKARELISYLDRRERLAALVAAVAVKRPEAFQSGEA